MSEMEAFCSTVPVAHSVLVPFSQLIVLRETNGADVRDHLDATKEQLNAMPRHDAE